MILYLNCPKEPPFYALASTYKNTSLNVKNTWRCSTLLGSILLCHKINEELVQSFLDALTEERCATFPVAIMLLRSDHAKQNIKEKLKNLIGNIELRKTVYTSIFGNEFTIALVYSDSLKVFDLRFEHLCKK